MTSGLSGRFLTPLYMYLHKEPMGLFLSPDIHLPYLHSLLSVLLILLLFSPLSVFLSVLFSAVHSLLYLPGQETLLQM